VALLVAGLAVGAAPYCDPGWLAAIGLLQLGLLWAFVMGAAFPGRIGALILGIGAAASADALQWHDRDGGLTPLLTVYGLLLPAMFLHQLSRGVIRKEVTRSLAGVASGTIAAAMLAGLVELRQVSPPVASAALLAAAGGLLAARLLDLARPAPTFGEDVLHGMVGIAGATVGGAAASVVRLYHVTGNGDPSVGPLGAGLLGAGIGVTVGFVAVGAAYVAVTARPRRTPFAPLTLPVLKVLLPLAAATPVAYLLGLVVTG
jgi:hypothetical protein